MMAAEQPALFLPELRQDLRLERGADGAGGAPVWLIIDPAQHRYVQIDEAAYQLLSCWQSGQPFAALIETVLRDFHVKVGTEELAQFVRFLEANNLTLDAPGGDWRHYASVAKRAEHGWLMWLIHNYLFIKLPLVRPETFLRRALPWVTVFFSRGFSAVVAVIGLTGIYLVSRQWDAFCGTFQHFFSFEGALTYSVALAIVKSAHELGHAFTAIRFGCRVPSMGICFLVMFPVLYTDVTDAWRLRSRRERLLIGGAGILVELAIACVATFAWAFLPEGTIKSLAFSIATVGWVLSRSISILLCASTAIIFLPTRSVSTICNRGPLRSAAGGCEKFCLL
jgi:putative peptide zinc metalloprotease protein